MKKKIKKQWSSLPQKEFSEWLSQYVTAGLAMTFFHKNKRWPKEILLGTVKVRSLRDGSGRISVEMR